MDELIAAVPPKSLISAAEQSPSVATAARLLDAVIRSRAVNKEYRREVMQVWAYHFRDGVASEPAPHTERLTDANLRWFAQALAGASAAPRDDRQIGPVVAEGALRKLAEWKRATLRPATADVEDRLRTILCECSRAATLDKHGDAVLHSILKLHLPPAATASLASEPPYAEMNSTHGAGVNDIVNKWLETPFEQLHEAIDFGSDDPAGLAIAGGLLAEVFDATPAHVAVNSEALSRRHPSMVVIVGYGDHETPDLLACSDGDCLLVAPQVRPIATVVLAFAERTPSSLLYVALTDPELLPLGCLPRRWLS